MNKKIVFGTLLWAIVATVLSGVVFMGIFGKTGEQWMVDNAACVRQLDQMPYWAWIMAMLAQGLLNALLLSRFGNRDFRSALITGLWVNLLMMLWFSGWLYITYLSYTLGWMPIDVGFNTLTAAISSGVVGWLYGRMDKQAA